ncbi:MAG: adenylate kinase [Bacteroidia bacterium]|jgi:adenylate kinase|tara:strand:- start:395 stop:982 length:588 start_codon:yes stop_codon:yes gene_type:complete
MLNIILFGPPGAGKGTQSAKLIEKYNLTHLSTGDVFRFNIKNETDLGVLAKSFIDKGELVPDEVTNDMVADFLDQNFNDNGFIFDGYPRTIQQADALAKMLEDKNTTISLMVALEVEEDELVKRLLERGKTSGRADDQSEDTIRNRFRVYQEETAPLATHYSDLGKYRGVHGMGSVDEIFVRLSHCLDTVSETGE